MNDFPSYEKNMLKAIEIFPEYKDAHEYLGLFYLNQRKFNEAKVQLEKTLQMESGNIEATKALDIVNDSLRARSQGSIKKDSLQQHF